MRHALLLFIPMLTVSCQNQSAITSVSDLPMKSTVIPNMDWQNSPLRANAQYALYAANSEKERNAKLGDYYFVDWYDAQPDKPAKLVMHYTQAKTGPQQLQRTISYDKPRQHATTHNERFFFTGQDRAEKGDILSWRLELYADGKLVDTKQSYLWE